MSSTSIHSVRAPRPATAPKLPSGDGTSIENHAPSESEPSAEDSFESLPVDHEGAAPSSRAISPAVVTQSDGAAPPPEIAGKWVLGTQAAFDSADVQKALAQFMGIAAVDTVRIRSLLGFAWRETVDKKLDLNELHPKTVVRFARKLFSPNLVDEAAVKYAPKFGGDVAAARRFLKTGDGLGTYARTVEKAEAAAGALSELPTGATPRMVLGRGLTGLNIATTWKKLAVSMDDPLATRLEKSVRWADFGLSVVALAGLRLNVLASATTLGVAVADAVWWDQPAKRRIRELDAAKEKGVDPSEMRKPKFKGLGLSKIIPGHRSRQTARAEATGVTTGSSSAASTNNVRSDLRSSSSNP